MKLHEPLPAFSQTSYSQLLDLLRGQDVMRSPGDISGSFATKLISGKRYWYLSSRLGSGSPRQVYIGPDKPEIRELVDKAKKSPSDDRFKIAKSLGKSLVDQGAQSLPAPFLSMLRRLTDAGAFKAGAVLIGTHAFSAYGPMLGLRWRDHHYTNDIDIAHGGRSMALALRPDDAAQAHDALTFDGGFIPSILEDGSCGVTYRDSKNATFEIDFVVPYSGDDDPVEVQALSVKAKPLRFLEFLLEDTQPAVALAPSGASLLVRVPNPARFAAHKLIVATLRGTHEATKSNKDLSHFKALAEVLPEEDLRAAIVDCMSRGPTWKRRSLASLTKLGALKWVDDPNIAGSV